MTVNLTMRKALITTGLAALGLFAVSATPAFAQKHKHSKSCEHNQASYQSYFGHSANCRCSRCEDRRERDWQISRRDRDRRNDRARRDDDRYGYNWREYQWNNRNRRDDRRNDRGWRGDRDWLSDRDLPDIDRDGIPDNRDGDIDGDGISNERDRTPYGYQRR